ncbi:MAG TPA: type I restriction-modification system subunit M N-terminal domain-containing protein, partial [Verrucomicrobiae bacterium]|nr:type I restriction-modification system subunit M N-terminal domain-containing protein [Verrucomicrobiae bacterium]
MTAQENHRLGKILWGIADQLRGAMNADDFRDYMLSFLFLRYLSDNYEEAAKRELGSDYPVVMDGDKRVPLAVWYDMHPNDVPLFERQMRAKVHYVIKPEHLWTSIATMAQGQHPELLRTLQDAFKFIETESFDST